MKATPKKIDYDFIGSQEPLTKEDNDLISAYFKAKKSTTKKLSKTSKVKKSKKVTA